MAKKISIYSLLLATALIFSYIEAMLPLDFIAPGIKIGFANCIVLLFIFTKHKWTAFFVNLCRIILSCLLFSGLISFAYAFCGALVSFIIMLIAKKIKVFSIVGVSILGGVFHNIAQCAVASLIFGTKGILLYYMPILVLFGAICGAVIGILSAALLKNKNIQNLFVA